MDPSPDSSPAYAGADLITRREALVRVAYLLGGTLSASTIAGVLAGCEPARALGQAWVPRTLTPQQAEMVLAMGEQIIPATDTPGARAARVDQFIDTLLTDWYRPDDRQRFLSGLERAEERSRRAYGQPFASIGAGRQAELVRALNRAAFPPRPANPVPPEQAARPANPILQENQVQTGNEPALPVVERDWDPGDTGPRAFFRMLKELVVVGYYTSEVGATQELKATPFGVWLADIPYAQVGRAWS